MDTASPLVKPLAYSYVRMSTERQLKGDSLRRQKEQSRIYAEQNGLTLVDDETLQDIGVSAFKGANIEKGALGRFIEAVDAGKIPQGSYLLVESLDRISRQALNEALQTFMSIQRKGINIVTLMDNQLYRAGDVRLEQIVMSVVIMSRAHEESVAKSHRIKASWANKRQQVHQKKLTARGPSWLRLSEDRKCFEIIESRAAIVRDMFEKSASGMGTYSIVRQLNERGIPPFGKSKGWQNSTVNEFLTSRTVLGEFQPRKIVDGQRIAAGDPVAGYYPAIIDEGLFYRVQAAQAQRRIGGRGRKGPYISNLFSGLARCGYCGSIMNFVDKGNGGKGGTYLVCSDSRRGFACERTGWRYSSFEAFILSYLQELDLEQIVRSADETAERVALDRRIEELRGKLEAQKRTRDIIFSALLGTSASPYVKQRFDECETEVVRLEHDLEAEQRKRDDLQSEASLFYESKDQIKELVSRFQRTDDKEIYRLRAQIASRLKSLIASLSVFATGKVPGFRKAIAVAEEGIAELEDSAAQQQLSDAITQLQSETGEPEASHPYVIIVLKHAKTEDMKTRILYFDRENPLYAHDHLMVNSEGLHRIEEYGEAEPIFPNKSLEALESEQIAALLEKWSQPNPHPLNDDG